MVSVRQLARERRVSRPQLAATLGKLERPGQELRSSDARAVNRPSDAIPTLVSARHPLRERDESRVPGIGTSRDGNGRGASPSGCMRRARWKRAATAASVAAGGGGGSPKTVA